MTTNIWESKEHGDAFFDELKALIDKYPNLQDHLSRIYAEESALVCSGDHDGYPEFDPKSPMYLQGNVVILNFTNMEYFEHIQILTPYSQPRFLTSGLLAEASVLQGIER